MLRQINSVLRIVFNQTYVTNTDALYKISFLDGINGKQAAVVFINSFTFVQCEITGREEGEL